ncbi:unnamed protein product [Phaedon cochleariae]|uniref:Uncharacterized protein n=1 Tax=Phaedon cochleariae TaxID=80249 RepID=A0A9P0DSQ9_PHACE|nr:unnamed protein product [Phaedon cochleariae]
MKFSRSNAFLILCILPLIKGQAEPRNSTCCTTPACLRDVIQQNLRRLRDTIPGPGIVSANPIAFDLPMIYHVNVLGIHVNITLNNNEIRGVGDATVSDVRWNFCGDRTHIDYTNTVPRLVHTANYTAVGTIRDPSNNDEEVVIDETGVFTMVVPNSVIPHSVNLTRVDRNGVNVWHVVSGSMIVSFRNGHVDFRTHSCGSDNKRADILSSINENLDQIIEYLRPEINSQFIALQTQFTRGIAEGTRTDNGVICPSVIRRGERRRSCRTNN